MKMRRLLLLTACLLATAHAEPSSAPAPASKTEPAAVEAGKEEDAPQYIRVEKTPSATQLQTALVHFKKGDATLDLIGAVHIADAKYYHELNTRFEGYDALLWEGIGSGKPAPKGVPAIEPKAKAETEEETSTPPAETPPAPLLPTPEGGGDGKPAEATAAPKPKRAPAKKGNLNALHTAYVAGAKYLGLSFQMNEVDYHKPNFVHADLTMEEFNDLQSDRKESLLGFALKASFASAANPPPNQPSSLKLLSSIISGDKNGLKRELVQTLGEGDDQVSKMAGESVIISDRNAKCLRVLDEQVAAGKKKMGIFYGAAHFPDMEKRLLESGWVRTGSDWLTAWDIGN